MNYKGSPSAMETVDAEKYSKSVTKHNLYYTSFYGDSKAFRALEMLKVQKSLLKSTNVLVTARKGLRHVFKRKTT